MDRLIETYGSARLPRYTSYPTAPHFNGEVDAETYRAWLRRLPADGELSLYLHVPYCREMCWYCGCHARLARRPEVVSEYVAGLIAEIDTVAAALSAPSGCKPRVGHVHFGGGSPNSLAADEIFALIEHLRTRFDIGEAAEIAMELDPRTLSVDQIRAMAAAGVTRASLGVQDFDPAVQQAINRIQPLEVTTERVNALRAAGIERINLDLMYGLPEQTVASVRRTAERALALKPDRVAIFGYAHVPWMKKNQRMIDEAALPDVPTRFAMAEAAAEVLQAGGMVRIGLDHFAAADDQMAIALADGTLRRNFQGYTDEAGTALIGFGASAIGSLCAVGHGAYVQNTPDIRAWLAAVKAGDLAVVRGRALTAEDRVRRAVIERLMCDGVVDLADVAEDATSEGERFADAIDRLAGPIADGLARLEGTQLRVTDVGQPFVRVVAACFDQYLEPEASEQPRRHAVAV